MAGVANGAYALAQPPANDTDIGEAEDNAKPDTFKGRGIESYKKMFRRAEEQCAAARKLAHRDRDWHDNFDDSQWSAEEKKILDKRRQPIITSNRIKRKIGLLCGMEQRQRSDPKAYPRNPQDENSATVVTDVLDYVETETRFDHTASQAFRDLNIEGIEAAEVIVQNGDVVAVNMLQYDGFFYDPRSRKRDFSDARYLGYQDWFDEDEAIELAVAMGLDEEKAKLVIESSFEGDSQDEGYEDKPYMMWGDSDRRRVRIACMYWKDGKNVWNYVYFTGADVIKEGVSIYLDDKGKPDCAIIAASAFMTRKNERFGSVREFISPQSEFNFRRSQALHLVKRKLLWQVAKGILPTDASEIIASSEGVLTANGPKDQAWGFIDNQEEIADNFQMAQMAAMEIDSQGPNSAMQGRGVEDQSGRAIIAQQQGGMAEENDIFDTHNDWKLRIYRAMWFRVKQFWTEPKFIRITDDENAFKFIHLNQPVIDPNTGQPAIDPQSGQPMTQPGTKIAEMDADIILEPAPDSITLQHEQFEQLTQMASSGVPIPPDILIMASQLKDKQKLAQRLKEEGGKDAQLKQAAQQIQQLQKTLQAMQAQLQKVQQQPVQAPPTVVDMAKVQSEQARVGHINAQTDHTRMQTAALAKETMQPPEGPEPPEPLDALDMADIRHKDAQTQHLGAQTVKTIADAGVARATAFKTVHETLHPPKPPAPKAPAKAGA